ncbi:hypothetical protein LINGRAHAP2_LOCUS20471 [Linum grandiflorum]
MTRMLLSQKISKQNTSLKGISCRLH